MPWREVSTMSLKSEFVRLASVTGANMTQLCQRFGITPKTGYKYLNRFREEGLAGLEERSRRPLHSPNQTPEAVVETILRLRDAHPCWGGRKLKKRLEVLGHEGVPSASTITTILARHGRLDPEESEKHQAWQRFEHKAPNLL